MMVSELAADSGTTADAEAVIRQAQARARRRRRRIATLIAVAATLLMTASAALVTEGLTAGRPAATGGTGPVAPGGRPGTIVGVIYGCPGALSYPIRMPRLGGVVTLLRGRLPYKQALRRGREAVIPWPVRRAVVAVDRIRPVRGSRSACLPATMSSRRSSAIA